MLAYKSFLALIFSASLIFADCGGCKGCGSKVADFSVSNPVIKEMKIGENSGSLNTAGYMTIKNPFPYPVTVNSISFADNADSLAETIELHTHTIENNIAKMQKVENFTLPANGEITLKPGSDHIMFISLKKSLTAGDKVPMVVNLSWQTPETKGTEAKTVTFEVVGMDKITSLHSAKSEESKKDCGCKSNKKSEKHHH